MIIKKRYCRWYLRDITKRSDRSSFTHRLWKSEIRRVTLLAAIVSIGLSGIYFYSGMTGLSGVADADELVAAAYEMRVAHPPGYGLLTLTTGVVMRVLPFEPLVSARLVISVFSGLTVGLAGLLSFGVLTWLWPKMDWRWRLAGAGGGMALMGSSRLFWFYTGVFEVMPLGGVLMLATLSAFLYAKILDKPRLVWAGFLSLGLMLGYHQLLWLTLPTVVLWIVAFGKEFGKKGILLKGIILTVLLSLVGVVLPYWIHGQASDHGWSFEMRQDMGGWWQYWSRAVYSGMNIETGTELRAFVTRVTPEAVVGNISRAYGLYLKGQFGIGLLMAAWVGLVALWSKRKSLVSWGLVSWYLLYALGIPGYLEAPLRYGADESLLAWALHERMFYFGLMAYGVLGGVGLAWGSNFILRRGTNIRVVAALLGFGVIVAMGNNLQKIGVPQDRSLIFEHTLVQADNGATIYCDDDFWCFGLLAQQTLFKTRPDVMVRPLSPQIQVAGDMTPLLYPDAPFFILEHVALTLHQKKPVYWSELPPLYTQLLAQIGMNRFQLTESGYSLGCDEEVVPNGEFQKVVQLKGIAGLDYQAFRLGQRTIGTCQEMEIRDCEGEQCDFYEALRLWLENPLEGLAHARLGEVYEGQGFYSLALREYEIAGYLNEDEIYGEELVRLEQLVPTEERLEWNRINAGEYRNRQ
jgi:hypothetical protein